MKQIVLINGSPRAEEKTTSASIAVRVEQLLHSSGSETHIIPACKYLQKKSEAGYETMTRADVLIFIFPLYYFCLPGMLMRFLQNYETYCRNRSIRPKAAKTYAVINCGFPEPEINTEAARVISCFSTRMGMRFRFGILIGGGPMLFLNVPPAKKLRSKLETAVRQMSDDIFDRLVPVPRNILLKMQFPRTLYYFMGSLEWKRHAKQNGLTLSDLYRRPYTD